MSREELVGAYLAGGMSRRTFVRRLVTGGVSLGAAISYAQLLKPSRAAAVSIRHHYPRTSVKIKSRTVTSVVDHSAVRLEFSSDEDLKPAWFRVFWRRPGKPDLLVAYRQIPSFTGPDTVIYKVPLVSSSVRDKLAHHSTVKLQAESQGIDTEDGHAYHVPTQFDTRTLTG